MSEEQSPQKVARLKKILILFAAAVILYTLVGFFLLPLLAKHLAVKNITQAVNRQTVINKIKINPYLLTLKIEGLSVQRLRSSEPWIACDQLFANLQAVSLFKLALVIKELQVIGPSIAIIRNEDGSYNFSDLLSAAPKDTEDKAGKPLLFSLNNISISNGSLAFIDTPQQTEHRITDLKLGLPLISNLPYHLETRVEPYFEARLNDTPVTLQGTTKPFAETLETSFNIDIGDIDLPFYLAYIPGERNFTIDRGMLSAKLNLAYSQPSSNDSTARLTLSGELKIDDLGVTDKGSHRFLSMPELAIADISVDLLKRKAVLGSIVSEGGDINLQRLKNGRLSVPQLIASAAEAEGTMDVEPAGEQAASWEVDIVSGKLNNYMVQFVDQVPVTPVTTTIDRLVFEIKQLTTREKQSGDLKVSLRLNKTGIFNAVGKLVITPLQANLNYQADRIALKPLQAYVNDFYSLMITDGEAGSRGTLNLTTTPKNELALSFKGKAAITNFAGVDSRQAEDFVSWKKLNLSGISAESFPPALSIDTISFREPRVALVVEPDGRLNMQAMIVASNAAKAEKKSLPKSGDAEKPATELSIGSIKIDRGYFSFQDRSLTPSYSMDLDTIKGSVDRISSAVDQPAEVRLFAKVNGHAPININGAVHPFMDDLFADLMVHFIGIDMSRFTPYSGKFIGNKIDKGKFSLKTRTRIKNRKMEVDNNIFFDQLSFGEAVDSPDSMNLPVKLAVALLKNRQGEIKLDLPIRGDFDDPEFSVGGIVFKVIFNLITKTITSPFSLLGAAFGGGEDVNLISFANGSASIDSENQGKLSAVAKALYERPGLNLDILGQVAPAADRQGLTGFRFQRQLKTQKLKEMLKKGKEVSNVDDVSIEAEEYERYLEKAYKAAPFKKPKNIIGLTKKQPPEVMERMLYENIRISEDDLRQLAYQRAEQVKDFLISAGPVEPERIFLSEPKIVDTSADSASAGASEAKLTIK